MSVSKKNDTYTALSTDTKPSSASQGDILHELDTAKEFIFNGSAWVTYSKPTSIVGSLAKSATVITVGADITPTLAIRANIDTDATVIFSDDTIPQTVKLLAGLDYSYSIKKVTVGAGIVGLY